MFRDKYRAALTGMALGEALGLVSDAESTTTQKPRLGTPFKPVEVWQYNQKVDILCHGSYGENTQLVLAVMRSMLCGGYRNTFTFSELPYWLNYGVCRDAANISAAIQYSKYKKPWDYVDTKNLYLHSDSSGAIARVLPYVFLYDNRERAVLNLIRDIIGDATVTHGNPKSILGATCFAFAMYLAINGSTNRTLMEEVYNNYSHWSDIENVGFEFLDKDLGDVFNNNNYIRNWNDTVKSMLNTIKELVLHSRTTRNIDVARLLDYMGFCKGGDISGDKMAIAAIFLVSSGIKNLGVLFSIERLQKTTIMALTSSLIGAFWGGMDVPNWSEELLDLPYLITMADIMSSGNSSSDYDRLRNAIQFDKSGLWLLCPIGHIRATGSFSEYRRRHMLDSGQTLDLKDKPVRIRTNG